MADVLLQKLPDPFLKSDGKTRVANAEEWRAQREWLGAIAGMRRMPPRPDKVTVEPLRLGREQRGRGRTWCAFTATSIPSASRLISCAREQG